MRFSGHFHENTQPGVTRNPLTSMLPNNFCTYAVFMELLDSEKYNESILNELRQVIPYFYGAITLKGEGLDIDLTWRSQLLKGDEIKSTIGKDKEDLLKPKTIVFGKSQKLDDGKYLGISAGWNQNNFPQFAFDVIAQMNGTYIPGRISSFYGMSHWTKGIHEVFAYGSNMCSRQMTSRCPSAKVVQTAKLLGFEMFFPQTSERVACKCSDGTAGGVASIRETGNPLDCVEGVIYKITEEDRQKLARYEGVDKDKYVEVKRSIQLADGSEHECILYEAIGKGKEYVPSSSYVKLIIDGANEHGLSKEYREKLSKIKTCGSPAKNKKKG